MCLQKSVTSLSAAHHRSEQVPTIVVKLSSLRLNAQLLIIIFFLFLQFFASPGSSNRHHLRGGTLPFVVSKSHTQSQSSSSLSSSSSPQPPATNYQQTPAPLIGSQHHQSRSSSSGKAASPTADWHSQNHAKQQSNSSSSSLTQEQLIAIESRVTPSKVPSPSRNDATYDEHHHHHQPDNQTTQSTFFQCPEQFGYFADLVDCTRYFVCVFGEALHETCTGGLYFSSELQTCDWPQNVICQNDPFESVEKSPSLVVKGSKDDEDIHRKQKRPEVIGKEKKKKPAEEESSFSTESSVEEDFGSNDLEQPAFDESIASFIDQNGDVYVHDGPGGLYSLIERTAAISDHDKPIVFRSAPAAALATENSLEKKTHTSAKPFKRFKAKCSKNCTVNQNVQFDDDELVNEEQSTYDASANQQQHSRQPEHLRPRANIVKKQLKDFHLEYHNKVDELREEEEGVAEKDRSADQVNGTGTTETKQATESPIITFVANKNDMWTDDSSKLIGNVNKYSINPNTNGNNKYSDESAQKMAKYKLRRSEKDAGTTPILTEDSILQVFRGVPSTSRRNYLLESFNTLPLPFPANLVKPWKTSSSASTTSVNREGKRNGKQIAQLSSSNSSNGTQTMTTTGNSTKSGKPVSGTEIHIFYSYRNPHEGSKMKAAVPASVGNLPVPTTTTVSRLKESSREQQPQLQQQQQQQQTGQSMAEIFTMRSSELLMSRNATTTSTTSTPPTTNAPVTTSVPPLPASVNLHLDYRYPGMTKQINRNAARTTSTSTTSTTTTTAPPTPVLYYQSLYTNYSHYDELFGQVKKSLEHSSTSTTTTTTTSTTTTTTTTTPSPASMEKALQREEEDPHALDIVEEVAEAVSPKHNFISYSAPSESGRPKGAIPSICDPSLNCKLPKCFCPGTKAPYGFKRSETPQMILLTFDDAVNDVNFPLYEEIFEEINANGRRRTNPNGCPIRAVFFVSHEWTDYGKVQTLYARGHEVASHSITHRFGEKFSTEDWRREHVGQREILHRYANIPRENIRGTRAAFLQIGGDKQFQMLMDGNFTYDSSVSIFDNSPPFWPYTLDFAFDMQHDCMISPCPTRSYPGLWEIGLVMWQNLPGGGRCTMGNSCNSPPDEQAVYELIMSNFKRHYESNRAPFPMAYHSAWFATPHHKAGFLRFIDEVLQLGDVYFVTNQQLLHWMRQPTKLTHIDRFKPWQCPQLNPSVPKKVLECLRPNICLVKFRKKNNVGSRYFKTCQVCPTDYPWIDTLDRLEN